MPVAMQPLSLILLHSYHILPSPAVRTLTAALCSLFFTLLPCSHQAVVDVFAVLTYRVLVPTRDIWTLVRRRAAGSCVLVSPYPRCSHPDLHGGDGVMILMHSASPSPCCFHLGTLAGGLRALKGISCRSVKGRRDPAKLFPNKCRETNAQHHPHQTPQFADWL